MLGAWRIFSALAYCVLVSANGCLAQGVTLVGSPALSLSGGTLTVVLANRNGFVIASDSRQTWQDGHFDDNSQKIFRLGPSSAIAIAGFANNAREPFASDLRSELTKALPKYTDKNAESWTTTVFESRLALLKLINATEGGPPEALNSYITLVRIGTDEIPEITTLIFDGGEPAAPPKVSTITAGDFKCRAFGIRDLVDAVQAGSYRGNNIVLNGFQSAFESSHIDKLSVRQMERIAIALIQETGKLSSRIGGPIQIGTFPTRKQAVWKQPIPPSVGPVLGLFTFHEKELSTGTIRPALLGISLEVVNHSTYYKSIVVLDGNVFMENVFQGCIIETRDRSPLYWRNNRCYDSYWHRRSTTPVPLDERCQPIDKPSS